MRRLSGLIDRAVTTSARFTRWRLILFLTGAQLALGSCDFSKNKGERFITLVTAALCIWNVGLGFLVGLGGAYLNRRGLLKL